MPDRRVQLQTPLNTDAGRAARVGEIMRDAATRLRGVCANLSDDQFDALLRHIADVTVKYEALAELRAARLATPPGEHPPSSTTAGAIATRSRLAVRRARGQGAAKSSSDPVAPNKQHLHHLSQQHIGEQREPQNGPVESRECDEAERRRERRYG
jgi:hypothetical protein